MSRFLAVKKFRALYPCDEQGEDIMRRFKHGEIVGVEVKRVRNVLFHRKFFALLSIILENQDYYKSMDDLLDVCKLSIGHCRTVMTNKGQVQIPMSISFAAMDDIQFGEFYDRACKWVITEVVPGLKHRDLDEAVEAELIGFGN